MNKNEYKQALAKAYMVGLIDGETCANTESVNFDFIGMAKSYAKSKSKDSGEIIDVILSTSIEESETFTYCPYQKEVHNEYLLCSCGDEERGKCSDEI